jgi:hypothetical protein
MVSLNSDEWTDDNDGALHLLSAAERYATLLSDAEKLSNCPAYCKDREWQNRSFKSSTTPLSRLELQVIALGCQLQSYLLGLCRNKRLVSRKVLMGSEVIIRGSEYHCYIDFKQSLAELIYLFHIP